MKLPNTAVRQVERRITRPTLAAGENTLASRLTLAAKPPCLLAAKPPCLLASRRQATSGSSTGRLLAARTYATVSAAELQFGQPVHETHPHILKAGERKLVCASLLRDHCNLRIQ